MAELLVIVNIVLGRNHEFAIALDKKGYPLIFFWAQLFKTNDVLS